MRNGKSTPPYEHLSRDDELQSESNSISNLKKMLLRFDASFRGVVFHHHLYTQKNRRTGFPIRR